MILIDKRTENGGKMANFALKMRPESWYLDFVIHAFKKKLK